MKCKKCEQYVKTIRTYLTALTPTEIEECRKIMHKGKHDYRKITSDAYDKLYRMGR